jgi:hypothetical protein
MDATQDAHVIPLTDNGAVGEDVGISMVVKGATVLGETDFEAAGKEDVILETCLLLLVVESPLLPVVVAVVVDPALMPKLRSNGTSNPQSSIASTT